MSRTRYAVHTLAPQGHLWWWDRWLRKWTHITELQEPIKVEMVSGGPLG